MIELKLEGAKLNKFKSIIDYLSNIFIEVQIDFTTDGFKITEASSSMGIETIFKPHFFSTLTKDVKQGEEEKYLKFGVRIDCLKSALRRCKDNVTINLHDQIVIKSGRKIFKMPVIELFGRAGEKPFKVPPLKSMTTDFEIDVSEIKEILEDSKDLGGESIFFTSKDKELKYTSSNYKQNSTEGTVDISSDGEASSKFGGEYLSKLFLRTPLNKVNLSLGKDYPLRAIFEDDDFKMSCVLAPRVDQD